MSQSLQQLPEKLKAYVMRAQGSLELVLKQGPSGKLEVTELLTLNVLYLGTFGLLAFLLPSLATFFYGGDGEPREFVVMVL